MVRVILAHMSTNDFEKLSAQMQQMEERILKNVHHNLNKSIDELRSDMNARFNTVDAKLERVDERLDGIDLQLATMNFKLEASNRQVGKHDALLNVVAEQVAKHDQAIHDLRARWQQKHA
jgi:chromosome segregation ATPase